MFIERHRISHPSWVRRQVNHLSELLKISIENVSGHPNNLYGIIDYSVKLADFQSGLGASNSAVLTTLRVTSQAAAAIFQLHRHGGITFALAENANVACASKPNPADISSGTWLFGFYGALICGDSACLRLLSAVPLTSTVSSKIRAPAYHLLFAQALQSFWNRSKDATKAIQRAVASSKIGPHVDSALEQKVLLPQVALLEALALTPAKFEECLVEAINLHKGYFIDEGKQGRPAGYLAFRLLGIASLAMHRGVKFEVESDYLPREK